MISCIVPVYNNENTILHVLTTLLACRAIGEVIVVDDCSQDESVNLIASLGSAVRLITNPVNLGKGGAVVKGIHESQGDTIFTCDADLSRLGAHHLERLIAEYQTGSYDMVIAGREIDRGWGALMASISGERIFRRHMIEPYLDIIATHGNGLEQIINYAHRGRSVKVIVSRDIGHVLKFQQLGLWGSIPAYAKEVYQLLETEWLLRKLALARRYKILVD
ncbi:MAG: glycosyltransferase family 2 protein [Anaerolineales bacterium]|nr:MAG: glycosyltransferase family 2 protein [Anaerolineales bacterium]